MQDITATHLFVRDGRWHVEIATRSKTQPCPQVAVRHAAKPISDLKIHQTQSGRWHLEVGIPKTALTDGVQTIVVSDRATQTSLTHLTLATGNAACRDTNSELNLLRAELEMLKRAFRRHCMESEQQL